MYSMTGYGKGEYRENGIELTVEVKSVNNRYLDLSIKSPRIFLCCEDAVRAIVREKVSRGHLDIFISYADKRDRAKTFYTDIATAKAYYASAQALKEAMPSLQDDTSLSFYLRLPDVVRQEEGTGVDDALISALKIALEKALTALSQMRFAEGERLKCDLLSRMQTISDLRDQIAERAPFVSEEYRKKLTDRMNEYLGGKVEESRILTEAAVFADKCNIDEELTRLSSHLVEFHKIAKCDAVGRKLDFLVQEFNRECNTICSKSCDTVVTACALAMKNEIEKVREQIQNLE